MLKGHRSMSCVSQQLLYTHTHERSPHSEFIVEEVIMIQAASHTNEIDWFIFWLVQFQLQPLFNVEKPFHPSTSCPTCRWRRPGAPPWPPCRTWRCWTTATSHRASPTVPPPSRSSPVFRTVTWTSQVSPRDEPISRRRSFSTSMWEILTRPGRWVWPAYINTPACDVIKIELSNILKLISMTRTSWFWPLRTSAPPVGLTRHLFLRCCSSEI